MRLKNVLLTIVTATACSLVTVGIYDAVKKPAAQPEKDNLLSASTIGFSDREPSKAFHNTGLNALSSAANAPENFVEAAEKTVNAVVYVSNLQTISMNFNDFMFGYSPRRNPQQREAEPRVAGAGSGVIISEDGYIVTNNHVIRDAQAIKIKMNNQKVYDAKVIGTDPASDIALLKIDAEGLPFLNFSNSDNVKVGQWVLAVGNPFNLTSTVTAGIVSALNRDINPASRGIESFIQTDAAINPGNSGGALVNTNGELIGINTAIVSYGGGTYEGYSFAVPSNIVQRVVKDLLEYGSVNRAYIGISWAVRDDREEEMTVGKERGVVVENVTEGGAAGKAGIKEGDRIVEIDGKPIDRRSDLVGFLAGKRPGDEIKVTYIRGEKKNEVKVTLLNEFGTTRHVQNEILGAKFSNLDKADKNKLKIKSGVVISEITGAPFNQLEGISQGDILLEIDEVPVDSAEEAVRILNSHKGNKKAALLTVYTRRGPRYFALPTN